MSQSPDEARAARIQKYKEERRKQLMARTATLFSANVTERRPKKAMNRSPSEKTASNLKSSSEINLNTATTSLPIRTTRTSRLRAAAANVDSSTSPKKTNNRSSSTNSLMEDDKTSKNSKVIERDKVRTNYRRQSNEKENLKSMATTTCVLDKEIGAIRTKLKHSINKNILAKDKSNFIVTSPKGKTVDEKNSPNNDEKKSSTDDNVVNIIDDEKHENVDEIFNNILGDKTLSTSMEKETFENLFNDIVVGNNIKDRNVEISINNEALDTNILSQQRELKNNQKNSHIPIVKETKIVHKNDSYVNLEERCVVPKVKSADVGGLLGAVCVRKVERFSELLSNLCSPCEADLLFEDILVENGINDCPPRTKGPECTPPCRRAQPTPRASSAKRVGGLNPVPSDGDGMLEAVVLKYYRGGLSKLLRYIGQGC
ncbi:hypothetical protein RR48_05310 [Papilio machaon]|uniref:Uncharacterized protein n=1 Tax=Papilio machaon TaxID=76193 RepID=A0A0N0PB31_PAPMA|nr:hypothetical protein RR48_05310 [Papilio machaon]